MDAPSDPVSRSCVDLRRLKRFVAKAYPLGHALREAVLADPDQLPLDEAVGKLPTYLRLAVSLRPE